MYEVSTAWKAAVRDPVRHDRVTGSLVTASGATIYLTDANILRGSLEIDGKAAEGSEFMFGATYAGQCTISLLGVDVDRYGLYNARLSLTYGLHLADNTWEEIPLGVWFVSEATRAGKILDLTALDAMTALDMTVTDQTVGTTAECLSVAAAKCGVELAQTSEQLAALPNGDAAFAIRPDRVDTYRDAVGYLAITAGCFAVIDRSGRLELRPFGAGNPVDTIPAAARASAKTSDFETYYQALTGRFIAEENYYPYSYAIPGRGDGLVLDIGDVPTVNGLPEFKNGIMAAVGAVLASVRYTPAELDLYGDPSLDLGDLLAYELPDGDTITTLATSYSWGYRSGHSVQGTGGNPKLASVKEKTRKQLADMESSITSKDLAVYTTQNSKEVTATGDTPKRLLQIGFTTTVSVTALLWASVPVTLDKDGDVVLSFMVDNLADPTRTRRVYLPAGEHLVGLHDALPCEQDQQRTVAIYLATEAVESAHRADEAAAATAQGRMDAWVAFDTARAAWQAEEEHTGPEPVWTEPAPVAPDTSVPTATVAALAARASILAQGAAGEPDWDGTITQYETIGYLTLGGGALTALTFTETMAAATQQPVAPGGVSAAVGYMTLGGGKLTALTFTETVATPDMVALSWTYPNAEHKGGYNPGMVVQTAEGLEPRTAWTFNGAPEWVDEGLMTACAIDYSGINRVDTVEVM